MTSNQNFEPPTEKMYMEAKTYGFSPIPLHGINKFPIENFHGYSVNEIDQKFKQLPESGNNVGILTGSKSGIIVVDVDSHKNGVENWEGLLYDYGIEDMEDFDTPIIMTPSGGYHFYFKYEEDKMKHLTRYTDFIKGRPGIDLLCNNAHVVYPGSIHPGCVKKGGKYGKCGCETIEDCRFIGVPYKWYLSPDDFPINKIPDWLFDLLPKPKIRKQEKESNQDEFIDYDCSEFIEGCIESLSIQRTQHYDQWLHSIWCLRAIGATQEQVHKFSKRDIDKYDENAVEKAWNNYEESKGKWNIKTLLRWLKEDLSSADFKEFCVNHKVYQNKDEYLLYKGDVGLSKIIYNTLKDDIIITDKIGNGFVWDENKKLWIETNNTRMLKYIAPILTNFVEKLMNPIVQQVKVLEKDDPLLIQLKIKLKMLKQVFRYVHSTAGLKNILIMCVTQDFYDEGFYNRIGKDIDSLPLKDGKIINMKTLEVRDRTKEDIFSFETSISYIKNNFQNAKKYFLSLFNGSESMVRYVQLYLGYCLTGYTSERSLYINWGSGRNGKTELYDIMSLIMKEYYTSISADVLIKRDRRGGATPELMTLLGARLVTYSESDDGSVLNADRIKMLTGNNDRITARALYKNEITFKPVCKISLLTNHKPRFDVTDQAMTDRIKLIPFTTIFENTFNNRNYLKKLKTEYLDEIGSFLIQGAQDWLNGEILVLPVEAQKELDSYHEELDTVSQFLREKCEIGKDFKITPKDLYVAYNEFCRVEINDEALKRKAFDVLIKKKFQRDRTQYKNKRHIFWIGLHLIESEMNFTLL
jgi:P4 family phage/plasmid primase-like protien